MRAERHALEARKVGNFARTLAKALPDESPEELERFVREDRRLAREGLVPLMDE